MNFQMTLHFLSQKIKEESLSFADAVKRGDESGIRVYSNLIIEFSVAKVILAKFEKLLSD